MPQLVKGGKYVFGWSIVNPEGRITIPPEAFEEYGFVGHSRGILISSSKTSGGFAVAVPDTLKASQLSVLLKQCPDLAGFRISESEVVKCGQKVCCWVTLHDNHFVVPEHTLQCYGVTHGVLLLVVRGSGLAPAFIVRGRIVEEAWKHPEIEVFS